MKRQLPIEQRMHSARNEILGHMDSQLTWTREELHRIIVRACRLRRLDPESMWEYMRKHARPGVHPFIP